jgi:hypothetical protein
VTVVTEEIVETVETEDSLPPYDMTTDYSTLTDLLKIQKEVDKEAKKALGEVGSVVDYVNEQRISLQETTDIIRLTAQTILRSISESISQEAKGFRRKRKAAKLDRLDFLDTYRIWVDSYNNPLWWIISPWREVSSYGRSTETQQSGDMFWGLRSKSFEANRSWEAPHLMRPMHDLTPQRVAELLQGQGQELVVCMKANIVRRIPVAYFKNARAIQREDFSFPIPDGNQIVQLLDLCREPANGTVSTLIV